MYLDDIEVKVRSWFSKKAKSSKVALEKAGDKVQEFADKNVVKMEKRQLQNQRNKKYRELGKKISIMLDAGTKITYKKEEDKNAVEAIQANIADITVQISEKDKELDD